MVGETSQSMPLLEGQKGKKKPKQMNLRILKGLQAAVGAHWFYDVRISDGNLCVNSHRPLEPPNHPMPFTRSYCSHCETLTIELSRLYNLEGTSRMEPVVYHIPLEGVKRIRAQIV
jgi:hypothetical protein